MSEALIVGIDPGNTSAVAALNLDGELVLLESDREFPKREIIQRLVEHGHPVVISSDRAKMPSTVEQIAQNLGAQKFEPEEDLDRQWKNELGQGTNSHEKDAVAAARHAHKQLKRQIRKIHSLSESEGVDRDTVAREYFSRDGYRTN